MKIAIASEGKDIKSEVCQAAGRAPHYLIFENKELIKTIKNPFAVGGGGAGSGVVQMLHNENVEIIISGKFGGNMKEALDDKKIKGIEIKGKTVEEAISEIK